MNEEEKCSINKIEISNSIKPPNDGLNYKTLNLKNNKYLHFTNEDDNNYIISSIKF